MHEWHKRPSLGKFHPSKVIKSSHSVLVSETVQAYMFCMSGHEPGDPIGLFEQLLEQEQKALNKQRDAAEVEWLLRIRKRIDERLREIGHHHHHHHRKYVLLQPTLTNLETGEPFMAAYALKTNVVAHFIITETDASGALVPVDPADVFTVTSSDPANLNAVIDSNAAGQQTVSVNWLHTTDPMLTGVGISISDSQGNTADDAETFDMVAPSHTAAQIGIDVSTVVETPQPTAV
jgi:hypothetical protein